MPSWQGKSKANTSGYKFFVFLIRVFGVRFAYFILAFVVIYYFFFSGESSKAIFKFYREGLKFSWIRSLFLVYGNYYVFGQTLIDKVAVMSNAKAPFTFDFDGETNLRKMVAEKKGGILLSAHVGSWEAAGHLLKRLNTRINIVMYDGEDAHIKKYLEGIVGEKTFNVIYVKNDISHIYKINEALLANEIVCVHADRYMPGNKTLTTDFFGMKAQFPEGPFLLALKLKVPITFVFSFKESTSHYHFYATELKYFYKDESSTMQDILTEFAGSMEKMIKKYPAQWFNYYDFWK